MTWTTLLKKVDKTQDIKVVLDGLERPNLKIFSEGANKGVALRIPPQILSRFLHHCDVIKCERPILKFSMG